MRYEGVLTRLGFGQMAADLSRMAARVLRMGWVVDRRTLTGGLAAQSEMEVTAAWGLVAVSGVLTQSFADGPTADKLRESLPFLVVSAVVSVAAALLSAWSTAMSGWPTPQLEHAVSARSMPRLTVGVSNVLVAGEFYGWGSIVFRGYGRRVRLRGGQWEKLGTARAWYRTAPFLFVDEPAPASDLHAETVRFSACGHWPKSGTPLHWSRVGLPRQRQPTTSTSASSNPVGALHRSLATRESCRQP
ncbi:hypothetical protein ACFXPV_23490 [Streptomyces sp. NPDC059118]|uniref:hypothetical protein n=1 Tax=unclassified Streptomyces TaxID=2593676 RepID=UPI0036A9C947